MKKILYLFLTVSLIFSSCKKEEDEVVTPTVISGCTDSDATNYNASATSDNGSCEYSIANSVWAITSSIADGTNIMESNMAIYFWSNGDFGWEEYDLVTDEMIDYAGGPGQGVYTTPGNNMITVDDGDEFAATFTVSTMTNNNNMTWTTPTVSGGSLVMTLERAIGISVDSWK